MLDLESPTPPAYLCWVCGVYAVSRRQGIAGACHPRIYDTAARRLQKLKDRRHPATGEELGPAFKLETDRVERLRRHAESRKQTAKAEILSRRRLDEEAVPRIIRRLRGKTSIDQLFGQTTPEPGRQHQ